MRKQISELRLSDLIQYPIWEYALDEEGVYGQDEQTVRPILSVEVVDLAKIYCVVRATFRANDGTQFTGSIMPQSTKPDRIMTKILPYDFRPVIYANEATRVHFGFGTIEPTPAQLTRYYGALGKSSFELFPFTFSSDVIIANGLGVGQVDGFMYFVDSNKPAHKWTDADLRIVV